MELNMLQDCENLLERPRISFHCRPQGLEVEVETTRLYIRSYRDEDFENCVLLYGNERLTRFFDHGKPRSRSEVEDLIRERGIKYFIRGEPFGLFSIFQKEDGAFTGQIDILPSDEFGSCEIGCIFHRQYQNQGFFPEASRAFLFGLVPEMYYEGHKYNGFPINKVVVTTHPKNYASKRIIESVGMSFDKVEERFGNPRLWYSYIHDFSVKKLKMET